MRCKIRLETPSFTTQATLAHARPHFTYLGGLCDILYHRRFFFGSPLRICAVFTRAEVLLSDHLTRGRDVDPSELQL